MAVKGGPEACCDAIGATLHTYLTTYLEAEWTTAADSVPKPYKTTGPYSWLTIGANVQEMESSLGEMPVIWMRPVQGHMTANGGPVWQEMNHRITAQAWLKGDRTSSLARQASRFLMAMTKCIQNRQFEIGSHLVNHVSTQPMDYTINKTRDDHDDIMVIDLTLLVTIEENLTS